MTLQSISIRVYLINIIFLFFACGNSVYACDQSEALLINQVTNPDGSITQGVHTETKVQNVINYGDEYYDWLKGYIERNNG